MADRLRAPVCVLLVVSISGCVGYVSGGDGSNPDGAGTTQGPELVSSPWDVVQLRDCEGLEARVHGARALFPFSAPEGWHVDDGRQTAGFGIYGFVCREVLVGSGLYLEDVAVAWEGHSNLTFPPKYNVNSNLLDQVLAFYTDEPKLLPYLSHHFDNVQVAEIQFDRNADHATLTVRVDAGTIEVIANRAYESSNDLLPFVMHWYRSVIDDGPEVLRAHQEARYLDRHVPGSITAEGQVFAAHAASAFGLVFDETRVLSAKLRIEGGP